jgi:hypothetical protein
MREPLAEGSSQVAEGHVLTTTEANNPTTQIPHPTHPQASAQTHDVSIDTGRPEGSTGQPLAQEEALTTDAAVPKQDTRQQIKTLEDNQQDSEKEIKVVVEDELARLHQENERLRLVHEQMIR